MDDYPLISSPQNPRLKGAVSLRDSRPRKKSKTFLIDGSELIQRAASTGFSLLQLFLSEEGRDFPLLKQLSASGCEIFRLSHEAMSKLQYGDREVDAIGVAQFGDIALGSLSQRIGRRVSRQHASKTILVLDRMEKPGNLGAALRTADAAGVQAVLLSDPICDVWNPNAVRSSLGALFSVPIAAGSHQEVRSWLTDHNINIYTARVEGAIDYRSADFRHHHAIVIGNEANGLEDRWQEEGDQGIFIPMFGAIDSLNASVSTAILTYESLRQQQGVSRTE